MDIAETSRPFRRQCNPDRVETITVAKNGPRPTALLTGAYHGEESEDLVVLMDLAKGIDAAGGAP